MDEPTVHTHRMHYTARKLMEARGEANASTDPLAGPIITIIDALLVEAYMAEWRIINGMRQHPDGLSFAEWKGRMQ